MKRSARKEIHINLGKEQRICGPLQNKGPQWEDFWLVLRSLISEYWDETESMNKVKEFATKSLGFRTYFRFLARALLMNERKGFWALAL